MEAIMITKEVWMNSLFSIARFSEGIYINGRFYIVIGSKEDLVDNRFAKYYHKLGRDRFIQVLEQNMQADKKVVMQAMEDALNSMKTIKRARKKQDNQHQTQLELC